MNLFDAIEKGKFREDLYYRLSTVDIPLPALRDRKDDIHLLFRKFASDFAHKYKMPPVKLTEDAILFLQKYRWSGNIRQLRNFAEQLSVLETNRDISLATIQSYLPIEGNTLPSIIGGKKSESDFSTERDILYKVLFEMKSDLHDLKKLTLELMQNGSTKVQEMNKNLIQKVFEPKEDLLKTFDEDPRLQKLIAQHEDQEEFEEDEEDNINYLMAETIDEVEILKLEQKEIELIKKSLVRHKGKRKAAADELGISERTLYRKIKQYDL